MLFPDPVGPMNLMLIESDLGLSQDEMIETHNNTMPPDSPANLVWEVSPLKHRILISPPIGENAAGQSWGADVAATGGRKYHSAGRNTAPHRLQHALICEIENLLPVS